MSTVVCASCNEPGHSRKTFHGCKKNPRNMIDADMPEASNVQCPWCHEFGHSRRTFLNCKMNPSYGLVIEEDIEMGEPDEDRK